MAMRSTHDLAPGDVVRSHGMRLLIDQELHHYPDPNDPWGPTITTRARCLNFDDITDPTLRHWLTERGDGIRWTIQGNGLARWFVEPTETAKNDE